MYCIRVYENFIEANSEKNMTRDVKSIVVHLNQQETKDRN